MVSYVKLRQARAQLGKTLRVVGLKRHSATERNDVIHFTPVNPLISDLYLVEFPKFGVTWLSFILANINLLVAGESRLATYFNINDLIPDIQYSRDLPLPDHRFPGFRIIKSHSPYNPSYKKVILLVRN